MKVIKLLVGVSFRDSFNDDSNTFVSFVCALYTKKHFNQTW